MAECSHPKSLIYGSGLLALDVVVNRDRPDSVRMYAGGTCGNVMIVLRYLGWDSSPMARLSEDSAGKAVLNDMRRWGVSLAMAQLAPRNNTPIIIEEIYRSRRGEPAHRFLWNCPECGAYLPSYRPVPVRSIQPLLEELQPPSVFFFDRVSPGALEVARHFASQDTVIVFEPSSNGDPKLFREAVRLCHILKYSHQRVGAFGELLRKASPWLQIETLGEEGLRYRSSLPLAATNGWREREAIDVPDVQDSAGSGDWCTAGIIHMIARRGLRGLAVTDQKNLEAAIRYGQALAAWNCKYEAPRGGMYNVDHKNFQTAVAKLLEGVAPGKALRARGRRPRHSQVASIFPCCKKAAKVQERNRGAAVHQ